MKLKDKGLIFAAIIFAGIFSLVLSNVFLNPASKRQATVEVVAPITAEFNRPDSRFFNAESVNPTQQIRIGDSENQSPFSRESN